MTRLEQAEEVPDALAGKCWRATVDKWEDIRWYHDGRDSYYLQLVDGEWRLFTSTFATLDGSVGYERCDDPRLG